MQATCGMFRVFMVAILAMMTLLAAIPLAASAQPGSNGGQGNSGAAHACRQGGWQAQGFASQGECVSYGAQGGTLQERATRTLAVTWSYGLFPSVDHPGLCRGNFYVTGFEPGTYEAYLDPDTGLYGSPYTITVGSDGTGSGTSHSGDTVDDVFLNRKEITVTVDGLSDTSIVSCSIPT